MATALNQQCVSEEAAEVDTELRGTKETQLSSDPEPLLPSATTYARLGPQPNPDLAVHADFLSVPASGVPAGAMSVHALWFPADALSVAMSEDPPQVSSAPAL
ncbi:unnamed protein product [Pleuronectes platessa]|uniref:Uncharacterized protein n=1 Tax=Pleuronectes platessa TaxID=8262 RepID=A0A9N7Z358_PLEPL|nr:unnamed protein product [Pleuronectes platessa]